MIVLDTNVVSELMRAEPAPTVLTWLQRNSDGSLYTTTVTVAEIRYGIARLPEGRRRESLHQAANEIFAAFPRQVLPFDLAAANAYADVVIVREGLGNPLTASPPRSPPSADPKRPPSPPATPRTSPTPESPSSIPGKRQPTEDDHSEHRRGRLFRRWDRRAVGRDPQFGDPVRPGQ